MADDYAGSMHIFDIDKTLVKSVTSLDFIMAGLEKGVIPFGILLSFPIVLPRLLTRKGRARLFRMDFPLLKGISREKLEKLARELFEEKYRPELASGMGQLVNEIRDGGGEVLIASASFRLILKPFLEALGARDIISTEIEFVDGHSTGQLREVPAYGHSKYERVARYLEEAGIRAESCSCYTDSHSDMPLLDFVGQPVAVNPDRVLRKLAEKRNWQIMEHHKGRLYG